MKEELNEKLASSLGNILEKLENGVEFAISEAPAIVVELLTYKAISCSIAVIFSFAALMPIAWFFFKKLPESVKTNNGSGEGEFMCAVVLFFITMGVMPVFFINLLDLIKLAVAPKLFIIEYVRAIL